MGSSTGRLGLSMDKSGRGICRIEAAGFSQDSHTSNPISPELEDVFMEFRHRWFPANSPERRSKGFANKVTLSIPCRHNSWEPAWCGGDLGSVSLLGVLGKHKPGSVRHQHLHPRKIFPFIFSMEKISL